MKVFICACAAVLFVCEAKELKATPETNPRLTKTECIGKECHAGQNVGLNLLMHDATQEKSTVVEKEGEEKSEMMVEETIIEGDTLELKKEDATIEASMADSVSEELSDATIGVNAPEADVIDVQNEEQVMIEADAIDLESEEMAETMAEADSVSEELSDAVVGVNVPEADVIDLQHEEKAMIEADVIDLESEEMAETMVEASRLLKREKQYEAMIEASSFELEGDAKSLIEADKGATGECKGGKFFRKRLFSHASRHYSWNLRMTNDIKDMMMIKKYGFGRCGTKDFGFSGKRVWIKNNCKADFFVCVLCSCADTLKEAAEKRWADTTGCKGGKFLEKRLFSHLRRHVREDLKIRYDIKDMVIKQRYSGRCRSDDFGFTGKKIWIKNDCKADFRICVLCSCVDTLKEIVDKRRATTIQSVCKGPGKLTRLFSHHNRKYTYALKRNGFVVSSMKIQRKYAGSCSRGAFGFSGKQYWIQHGCKADFYLCVRHSR